MVTGVYASTAILAALQVRDRSGYGQHIDMALLDVGMSILANQASAFLNTGVAPQRQGNINPSLSPYQDFRTQDGAMMLAIGNNGQFQRFCEATGQIELARDARFATNTLRVQHRDALVLLLHGSFGILDEYRLKLRLGVRLPGNADSYVRLLRDLLYPGISLSLECTPGAPDREALHRLRFYSDFFALHPELETGSGWSADDIRTLVEAAGGLAARPRRIGIVTDDIQSAAALAAGYNRPAAAETAQIEGESSC